MVDQRELLREYVRTGSQTAFTTWVERHVNLVYSAALRRVDHDVHQAQEVTQTVFTQAARKADSLQNHPALSGWLHQCTRFAALDARRRKLRREKYEETSPMTSEMPASAEREVSWSEVSPLIDTMLDRLGKRDRDAVLLRFFEGHSFAQISATLEVSEDAARMRVGRALERMRSALARRGLHSSAAALGLALTQQGVVAAPSGLVASVSVAALSAIGDTGGAFLTWTNLFTMSKIKVAVTSAVVIAGLAALVIEMHTNEKLASTLANQRERLVLLSASDRLPSSPLFASVRTATDNHSAQELAQLQARIVELRNRPDGVVNAEIKPRSTWKDAGHATPEAALETFMWAATNRNFDTLASSYVFGEKSKAEAGAFFATLSPQVQARYGTPERLLAPYIVSHPTKSEVDAMQPIDVDDGGRSDEVVVRYWVHLADGSSHVDTLPFQHVNGEWRMGSRRMGISIPEAVDYIHTHVDPAIGP